MKSMFKEYLMNGMVQADTTSLAKMCAYFIFYGIPYPIDNKSICKSPQALYFFVFAKDLFHFPYLFFSEFDYDTTVF